ncbi:unnamed protein product [marine sediment metagenome]|uniref:PDGLE domain-containing protein n=1 Tax=marine sediment metagenome TaxID=412755 RepID=X1IX53_9ZZZZ
MALGEGSLVNKVVQVLVLAMVVGYCVIILADTKGDLDAQLVELNDSKATEAIGGFYDATYEGINTTGTIVKLVFVGMLIAAVVGFGYIVTTRR